MSESNGRKRGRYNQHLSESKPIPRRSAYARKRRQQVQESSAKKYDKDTSGNASSSDEYLRNSDDEDRNYREPDALQEDYVREHLDYSANVDTSTSDDSTSESEDEQLAFVNHQPDDMPPDDPWTSLSNEPLYPGANISSFETLVCILAYFQRYNVTGTCVEGTLELLRLLLPKESNIPTSKYSFLKKLNKTNSSMYEMHYYCEGCKTYLGKCPVQDEHCNTSNCETVFCNKSQSFFLYMPLTPQLKEKFECGIGIHHQINEYKEKCKQLIQSDTYTGILDGEMYSRSDLINNPDIVTLHWNVDGLPVYKSNSYQVWPIQCALNELDPQTKKHNIMITGMWFGKSKPNMQECFLKPFVEELQILRKDGFNWDMEGGIRNTKVIAVLCTADSPARALVQNIKQFNANYGCSFCLQKSKRIVRGKGFSASYPIILPFPPLRTASSTFDQAAEAVETGKDIMGVKGPSSLMRLNPEFDIIKGFSPDYMHCALLGVTRHFVTLFLGSAQSPWHISDQNELDSRIGSIKVTREIPRRPRSGKELSHWKATEWRTFLLLSPLLLKNLLPAEYYNHWLLFAYAINQLSCAVVTKKSVTNSDIALRKFVFAIKDLYGEGEQTFNAHLLLHLANSVVNWGPLGGHSAFMFENNLGKIKQLNHGTKSVPIQIFKGFLLNNIVERSVPVVTGSTNAKVSDFFMAMHLGYTPTKKHLEDAFGTTAFGKFSYRQLSPVEFTAASKIIPSLVPGGSGKFYKRCVNDHVLYTTAKYCEDKKRQDCVVRIENTIFTIVSIASVEDRIILLAEFRKAGCIKNADADVGNLTPHILKEVHERTTGIFAFLPNMVSTKCCIFSNNRDNYFVPLPNLVERD